MANNKFQLKRTSITGRTPNTTISSNASYIDAGELAINLTDRKLFSSNGTVSFEVGSNVSTLTVGSIVANGETGAAGETLFSNGTHVYWGEPVAGNVAIKTFSYSIASNTTVIEGADDFGQVLSYTSGIESVYINGIKVVGGGQDYTTTNASAVTLTSNVESGEIVEVVSFNPLTNFLDNANNVAISSNAAMIADSFSKAAYRTAKYLVSITSNAQFHSTEVLVVHDGTTAYSTEYGTIYSNNSLGVIAANLNNANVELIVTPTYSDGYVKTKRITLEV
jgi:hypothetical protein